MKSLLLTMTASVLLMQSVQGSDELLNIKVTESGVYQMTYDQLMAYGLDISGYSTDELALFNQGEPVPIEVLGPDVVGDETVIRFIGHGLDTLYTDTNVYTLRLDSGGARIGSDESVPIPGLPAATSYLATKTHAPQNRYSFSSPNANDPWSAQRIVSVAGRADESVTVSIDLDDYQPGGNNGRTKAKLSVDVWGGTDLPGVADDHHMVVSLNNDAVIDKTFDGLAAKQYSVAVNNVKSGTNTVRISLPRDMGYSYDLLQLNEVSISYPRKFRADGQRLQFSSAERTFHVRSIDKSHVTDLGNPSASLVVYRVDGDGVSRLSNANLTCSLSQATCRAEFAGSGDLADYYVSTVDGLLPTQLSALPVEQDINSGQAKYLIISHPDFLNGDGSGPLSGLAEELRQEFGSADVVDVTSIYAQYNDHVFDPVGIQNYIRYAHEKRGTEYVLLVGGDVYDYRGFVNEEAMSFIPSIYAATGNNINFAPVDAKYVDLNDDNIPDLPIGRLPVRTLSELETLIAKRASYNSRSYTNSILLAADGYDDIQQYEFKADAEQVRGDYFSGWDVVTAYVDDQGVDSAKSDIIAAVNAGQTLTSFFGHSSTNRWSFSGLFDGENAAGLSNAGKPTVVTQWGCWNTYYVDPSEESMGHRFMMEGDRGAVAVMGATTLTSADAERKLATLVYERLANGERLGNAITNAKQDYGQTHPQDLDVLLGWTLLGMPELIVN